MSDGTGLRPHLPALLRVWLEAGLLADRRARLADGGADADDGVDLARVFVDLPAQWPDPGGGWAPPGRLLEHLLACPPEAPPRALIIGGPGAGKSTVTAMLAQALRAAWLDTAAMDETETGEPQPGEAPHGAGVPLPEVEGVRAELAALGARLLWPKSERPSTFPLRIDLPELRRSMAERPGQSVWAFLAGRAERDLRLRGRPQPVATEALKAAVLSMGPTLWILDGLDEVPPSAGRAELLAALREERRAGDGWIVSTRPQGYRDELDELRPIELLPLDPGVANAYAEGLVGAWVRDPVEREGKLDLLQRQVSRPAVRDLFTSPLHVTMATLLVLAEGELPLSRAALFQQYFERSWGRELRKQSGHGLNATEKALIVELHRRAALTLHVRAQSSAGARPGLRRKELHTLLVSLYEGLGEPPERAREQAQRMARFAVERLVWIVQDVQGEHTFTIRPLQEHFAAEALIEGEVEEVRRRFEAIASHPHWEGVLRLAASALATRTGARDLRLAQRSLVELCRDLNAGRVGGEGARRLYLGSRLAMTILGETAAYGKPWLHDGLWNVALEAARAPMMDAVAWAQQREDDRNGRRQGADRFAVRAELHHRLGDLVCRWPGPGREALRDRLLQTVEELLGEEEARWTAWRILEALAGGEDPDVLALADRHFPAQAAEVRRHARQWSDSLWNGGAVLRRRMLDRYPELHTPSDTVATDQGRLISLVAKQLTSLRSSLRLNHGIWVGWTGGPRADAGFIHNAGNPSSAFFARDWLDGCTHPRRGLWWALAGFHTNPTLEALAELLSIAAANVADFEELRDAEWAQSWQVRSILAAVEGPEELYRIVEMVSSGELGSAADWLNAEKRWSERKSLSIEDLRPWIETDAPWNHDIGERGLPFSALASWHSSTDHPDLRRAFELALKQTSTRLWKAGIIAQRLLELDSDQPLVPYPIAAAAEENKHNNQTYPFRAVASLLPDLSGIEAEGWFELLDRRGRLNGDPALLWRTDMPRRSRRISSIIGALIRRVNARPDQWGILDAICAALIAAPTADLSGPRWDALFTGGPPKSLARQALVQILAGPVSPERRAELLPLLGDPHGTYDFRGGLARILPSRPGLPNREALLLGALDVGPSPSGDLRDGLLGALQDVRIQEQRPALDSVAAWAEVGLPEPYLPLPKAGGAVVLHAIRRLRNIRAFADTPAVSRPFPIPRADEGQWILLIGENGVGKTTLLRALALALAESAIGTRLLDERNPLLRNGGEGEVEVLVGEGPFEARVRRTGRAEEVVSEAEPEAGPERPWVVAYGVRRGDARGELDRAPEPGAVGELHTLFDRPASLYRASSWLSAAEANAGREARRGPGSSGKHAAVWAAAKRALVRLLELTDLFVDEDGIVRVVHPTFGTLRLDALSDGYLTTAGWVVDMLARWVIRQDELDAPFGADLLSEMRGLVLIDEIDLHLHPLWQLRVVEDLRALFPRLSFIATTHNPLCLQGARTGEIYRMRREGTALCLEQEDIGPGDDVDRILLDQFGVPHTEDPGTRLLLARHRQLLREGKVDDAERRSIERELAERLGGPPSAPGGGGPLLAAEERSLLTPFLKKR